MPELPEIQTILNGLRRFVLNQAISSGKIFDQKLGLKKKDLKILEKNSFSDVFRIGKLLVFVLEKGEEKLLIHLKMTGQLIFCSPSKKKESEILLAGGHSERSSENLSCQNLKHLRLEIIFKNQTSLLLNDARKFAYAKMVNEEGFKSIKKRFGLEPLDSKEFNWEAFLVLVEKRKGKNIKAFLLDQSLIAGIGNIYADEILFASKIDPRRKVQSLRKKEKELLFENIKTILKLAVAKKGTTFSDYLDVLGKSGGYLKLLKVYGRQERDCLNCSTPIRKIRLVGRGTHYCPRCQK